MADHGGVTDLGPAELRTRSVAARSADQSHAKVVKSLQL